MAAIFLASATPATELPRFGSVDYFVKKGGHMLAYAFLTFLYWRALEGRAHRFGEAWALAVLYALVDEYHQSFVPGRHPSLVDAFLFDGGGATAALLLIATISRFASRRVSNPANRG